MGTKGHHQRPRLADRDPTGAGQARSASALEVVTMCDLRFLPQSLLLHRSIRAHATGVGLTVLCMDDHSLSFLGSRRLAGVELVDLRWIEEADPQLAATRTNRTWTEYCWTVIPALCYQRLERATDGTVVAWVDADVEFETDPRELARQLGDGSVLLTPHRYNRAYPTAATAAELTARYGRFNGGTIAFRRDAQGMAAARLWRARTLEWCRDSCEPGRFGNQLHLDDFPRRFHGARVLRVPGGVLGPWNGGRYLVRGSSRGPTADGRSVIAYHYQSLRLGHARPLPARLLSPNVLALPLAAPRLEARAEPHYRLSRSEVRQFWKPHGARLAPIVGEVLQDEPSFAETLAPAPGRSAVLNAIRTGLTRRAGRHLLPFYFRLRAEIISAVAVNLAGAARRRALRRR